jgi:hypothetical protein
MNLIMVKCLTVSVKDCQAFRYMALKEYRLWLWTKAGSVHVTLSNHCCSGKAVSITYSKCVFVALGIQHVMRRRRTKLSSVACLALSYLSTLSYKRHDFRGKKLMNINVCWFSLQLLSETFLILRRTKLDMNVHGSSCEVLVVLVRF